MNPRSYSLGQRAEGVRDTREKILLAAAALLARSGFHQVSVEDVAREADVVRATVYNQFGSKLGLVDALVEYTADKAGIGRVHDAVQQPDGRQALQDFIVELCGFWTGGGHVFRNVMALGAVDPQVRRLVDAKDRGRRLTVEALIRRLAEQGQLHPAWTPECAADALWTLTNFETFDALHRRCDLSVDQTAETLARLATCLLRPKAAAG